jgi:UDP-glucuronate 4-epimerase
MNILVTGTAGFIGFHLVTALIRRGHSVVGLDNINSYYDPRLKMARLKESGITQQRLEDNIPYQSQKYGNYIFYKLDLTDRGALADVFKNNRFDNVCHLAAQAGVRYSLENPHAYIDSNIVAFQNMLECLRNNSINNFCFASTSSIYGLNTKMPFSEKDNTDQPASLYAATKKSNELMAYVYSYLYGIRAVGLRFFTVYGPWGRPDMALFKFVNNILDDKPIEVYNYGNMKRDFTYINDIVEGVCHVIEKPAPSAYDRKKQDKEAVSSAVPYRIYNIGCGKPVALMDFVNTIEKALKKKAKIKMLPMQAGDVYKTYADTTALERDYGYKPTTDVVSGVSHFVDWYKNYYHK